MRVTEQRPDATSDDEQVPFVLPPQEVILGLFGEYVKPGQLVWSGGLVKLLTDLRFSTTAARVSLNRVVARGLLQRQRQGRLTFYCMTPRLEALVEDGRRQTYFFQREEAWDGTWTFVWYSIPDTLRVPRRRLARRLSFLGFGAVQDGVWLMPRNREAEVTSLIRDLQLHPYVGLMVGRLAIGLAPEGPIEQIWDLAALAEYYKRFVEKFSVYDTDPQLGQISPQQSFLVRTRAIDAFRQLASMDPKLPDTISGYSSKRAEAIRLFQDLTDQLQPGAKTYFDNTTST